MTIGLVETAHREIRKRLASGEYPLGARLSNRALAKDVNMSLTPVREALSRLVSEGLLGYQPGIGVFVPIPTEKEIADQYELRTLLECGNIAKITGTLSDTFFQNLQKPMNALASVIEQIRRLPAEAKVDAALLAQWREADGAFHNAFLRAGNNLLINRLLENLCFMIRIQQRPYADNLAEILEVVHQQHIDLVDSLKANNRESACRIMKEHVAMAHTHAIEAHQRQHMGRPEFDTFDLSGGSASETLSD